MTIIINKDFNPISIRQSPFEYMNIYSRIKYTTSYYYLRSTTKSSNLRLMFYCFVMFHF